MTKRKIFTVKNLAIGRGIKLFFIVVALVFFGGLIGVSIFNPSALSFADSSTVNEAGGFTYIWEVKDVLVDTEGANKNFKGFATTGNLKSGDFFIEVDADTQNISDLVVRTPGSVTATPRVGDVVYDDGFLTATVSSISGLETDMITEGTKISFAIVIDPEGYDGYFDPEFIVADFGSVTKSNYQYLSQFETQLAMDLTVRESNSAFFRGETVDHISLKVEKGLGTLSLPVQTGELSPGGIVLSITPRIEFTQGDNIFLAGNFPVDEQVIRVVPAGTDIANEQVVSDVQRQIVLSQDTRGASGGLGIGSMIFMAFILILVVGGGIWAARAKKLLPFLLVIFLLIAIGGIISLGTGLSLVGLEDEDFLTFDDFQSGVSFTVDEVDTFTNRFVCESDKYIGAGFGQTLECGFELQGSSLRFGATRSNTETGFLLKRDFYGNDFRTNFRVFTGAINILINGKVAHTIASSSNNPLTQLLEIKSGDLNPNEYVIVINGIIVKTGTLDGQFHDVGIPGGFIAPRTFTGRLVIGFTTPFIIEFNSFKYQIPFKSCAIPEGHLLVSENYGSGKEADIFSSTHPVVRYCLRLPVIRTSSNTPGAEPTAEPYLAWIQGKSVTVPEGETWKIFYIMDNSKGQITTACSIKDVYDLNQEACQGEVGLVDLCGTDSVYDVEFGGCAITSVKTKCIIGRLVLGENNTSKCVYNPPQEQICKQNTFNTQTGTCQSIDDFKCPEGYTEKLINNQKTCSTTETQYEIVYVDREIVKTEFVPIVPETDKNNLIVILLIMGGLVGAVIVFIYMRRK